MPPHWRCAATAASGSQRCRDGSFHGVRRVFDRMQHPPRWYPDRQGGMGDAVQAALLAAASGGLVRRRRPHLDRPQAHQPGIPGHTWFRDRPGHLPPVGALWQIPLIRQLPVHHHRRRHHLATRPAVRLAPLTSPQCQRRPATSQTTPHRDHSHVACPAARLHHTTSPASPGLQPRRRAVRRGAWHRGRAVGESRASARQPSSPAALGNRGSSNHPW